MPDEGKNERREARVTNQQGVESFDAVIQEYVTNISRTGVFIKSKTPLSVWNGGQPSLHVIMDEIETNRRDWRGSYASKRTLRHWCRLPARSGGVLEGSESIGFCLQGVSTKLPRRLAHKRGKCVFGP